MVTAAYEYAGFGWPVFPVAADKRPLTRLGFKAASRDSRLIAEWWRRWPEAGIGFAIPEGLLVFDIDPRNGGVRPPELPRTKEAGTRSGGAHLYYSVPPDLSFVGQYAKGIDLKAGGKGYTILPPTPGYDWTTPWSIHELPNDVLDRCVRPTRVFAERIVGGGVRYVPWEKATRYGAVALENQAGAVRDAPNGERNNTLFKATATIARLIAGGELDEAEALKQLKLAGETAGLDTHEVIQTMLSGYAVGINEPRRAPQ